MPGPQQDDPFAAYVVQGDDPFAAYAVPQVKKPEPESIGRRLSRATLDTLPAIGGLAGGIITAPLAPETMGVGTLGGIAVGAGAGRGLRDLIAEATGLDAPTTPLEKAGGIAKETAFTALAGKAMPGVEQAIRTPIQTTRELAERLGPALPQSVRRIGRIFTPAAKSAAEPILQRPPWQTWGAAVEEPIVAPEIARSGTGFLRTGPAPTGEPSWNAWKVERPAGAAATSSAQPLTAAERSSLASRGFTPEAIAKVEQAAAKQSAGPVASHAPTPSAPTPVDAPSPLQQPRVQVGAERVGRANGLTKQEVRTQTGPVLDEAVGDASPILPKKALQRIIDDMKALPKEGPEREAYVARATSGKTKSQVENVRRTLEHLGLIVPFAVAAPTLRDELQRMMSSHGQTSS